MSDIERQTPEDEQILQLLDDLATMPAKRCEEILAGDCADSEVRRENLETVGQLPYALQSVSPDPALKSRIMARLTGSDARLAEFGRRSNRGAAMTRSAGWLLPLAASLAFILTGVTGWQVWRVNEQAETIARLSTELERSRQEGVELAVAREVAKESQARLSLLTASAAEFCALKPTVSCPNQEARGTIVMHAGRSEWFLRVEGLGPCEKGRQYKLWFVTDSAPVLGASFMVEGSHELVEIRATGAPEGVKAVMITLEEPEVEGAPETPVLLFGDQTMRVL